MDTAESNAPLPEASGSVPPSSQESTWRWSWLARLAFLFTGVVLPAICFLLGFPDPPSWQSGNLEDYAQLLLLHKPSSALYPFLLYNMTCMALLVYAPARFAKHSIVRFGIYTGVLLALQYWVIFGIALPLGATVATSVISFAFWSSLAVLIPWLVGLLIVFLARKFGWKVVGPPALFILLAVGIAVLELSDGGTTSPGSIIPAFCLLCCLFCATPWAVASYVAMAVYVARHSGVKRLRFSLAQLFGVLTWLAAYLGAWRTSFNWMLQEYAKLPTTPPQDCYVCTAAARGHRRLVGAEDAMGPCSDACRVNDQMCYLKAAELLLACISPTGHRTCRRIYDRIGPRLAAWLVHPLLADAAYLSLKPLEWLFRAGLALWLPGRGALIRSIYGRGS